MNERADHRPEEVVYQDDGAIGRYASSVPRTFVGGLEIPALTRQQIAGMLLDEAILRRGRKVPCLYLSTANGQVISMCARDQKVHRLFQCADGINADGMSVVFASRWLTNVGLPERVATTDMFHDAAKQAQERGASFYFLGAKEDMNRRAVEQIRQMYPKLRIAGRRNGYFSEADEPAIVADINQAQPDVLWLGLGVPRQQQFAVRHRANLTGVGAIQTCGGLFDFVSGKNSRAPMWMQQAGLEWAYRLMLEPRRLFLRYAFTNVHAIAVMLTKTRHQGAD